MGKFWVLLFLIILSLSCGSSSASASASPPAKIIGGLVSNVVSALVKWVWSLKSTPKPAHPARSLMKFEGGYSVETLLEGEMLGIDTQAVEVLPNGELLLLDSANSNIFKISTPVSPYSRPKLVAGSSGGYSGHVDGKPRDARMNHPKGLAVDDRGNIYVADTMNKAIRKISDTGGKWGRSGAHTDGPSEDAKFSSDFDLIYVKRSCSLLVLDRGNQAIREIPLREDDCAYQREENYEYDGNFHLGIAVFMAAGFFGYMLALLQRRVRAMFSSKHDPRTLMRNDTQPMIHNQRPHNSVRPPLIPAEYEPEKTEEGFFGSLGRLFLNTGSSIFEIIGGLFSGSKKRPPYHKNQLHYQQQYSHPSAWPAQESYVVPDEDEPPKLESRATPPKDDRSFYGEWSGSGHYQPQYQLQPQSQPQYQPRPQMQPQQQSRKPCSSSNARACDDKRRETNEFVFGAVQEQDGRREAVVIKAVDYGNQAVNPRNIRPRINYMGYSHRY